MKRRQSRLPRQWLIDDGSLSVSGVVRRLPHGSGIIVLRQQRPARAHGRRIAGLRRVARLKRLTIVDEGAGEAVRVHNLRELRRALQQRAPIVLLSPIYPTRSHPEWEAIPRMRSAALARLGQRRLFALGGMDECRFRRTAALGFIGWAGIDAWASRSASRI